MWGLGWGFRDYGLYHRSTENRYRFGISMLLFRKPLHFWNLIDYFPKTATLSIWWHRPCWCFLGISSACPWGCSFAASGVHRKGTIFNFVEKRCLQNEVQRNIEQCKNSNLVSPETSYCHKCATRSWHFDYFFINCAIGPLYICLWPWVGLLLILWKPHLGNFMRWLCWLIIASAQGKSACVDMQIPWYEKSVDGLWQGRSP